VSEARWRRYQEKAALMEKGRALLGLNEDGRYGQALRRPEGSVRKLFADIPELEQFPDDVLDELEVEAKYAGFIEREEREAERLRRHGQRRIPPSLDYRTIPGLSNEAREKLGRSAPATLSKALEAGISPSDAMVLMAFLEEGRVRRIG